ncbi:MAG: 16S rRNA (cytosine(1402)-N(4))-methyltransferase RsmH [SAR324 cluster bacterium]|nr:16S rRNA (cytosine(1402)-N(4))-methyltransferase RsmH [SAR324 cluster bacterium]
MDAMQPNAMPISEAPPTAAASPEAAQFKHTPVLLEEVLHLAPAQCRLVADVTLGGGGHARALLDRYPESELFGCDRDPAAVAAAGQALAPCANRILLKQIPFSALHRYLLMESVDFMLGDLGVSSPQLESAGRGFSFTQDGPLDMRMDPLSGGTGAEQLVNTASEERLQEIFFRFGEERFGTRIAKAITAARHESPITTTGELAALVAGAVPARFHRKGHHPATKVFQALRIAVNDELGELEQLLEHALHLLRPGGRIALISFHSLEDRMVKTAFNRWEKPCTCPPKLPKCVCGKTSAGMRLSRKPVTAGAAEAQANPRSRSAKLRAFEKR